MSKDQEIIEYFKQRYSSNFSQLSAERSFLISYICITTCDEVCNKYNLTINELYNIINEYLNRFKSCK